MAGRAAWDSAGRVRFDPVARRRVRRAGARARPWLLPASLVVAGLLLAPTGTAPASPAAGPPSTPVVPDGLVLVAVRPADASVLPLVAPGSRVDVYAAEGAGPLDLPGEGPAAAELVVRGALVAETSSAGSGTLPGGGPAAAGAPGVGLGPAGTAEPPTAVPLLVTDAEAGALAARPGGPFLLAVRGTAAPVPREDG